MEKSESIKNVIASLVKFNLEVTKISKDAKNPFYKNNYATLDQIIDQVRPILASHGLIAMQDVSSQEQGYITVKTNIMHESGEFIQSSGTTIKLTKDDAQGVGANTTYGRRYDLTAMLSLNTGDDDDGNIATGKDKNTAPKKETPKEPEVLSMTQKNEINKKSKEYIKIRGKGSIKELFDHLKISDLDKITPRYAVGTIKSLDLMLAKAKEQAETDKQ